MKRLTELKDTVTALPRGGFLVDTVAGYIQFGSPPETIKDTMSLPGDVPRIFVLLGELFNWLKGISVAEIEFPIYYNFFLKKKKTYVICNTEQYEQMKLVLQESIFGPEELDITRDFESDDINIPDIKREMAFFRNNLNVRDLIEFCLFKNNQCTIEGVTVAIDEEGNFSVSQGNDRIAEVPGSFEYTPTYLIGERLPEPYIPPLFGVTCLGPSHGFDPEENTSGFVIWLNHSGIMVDPPVNSTEWLEDSNVNPKLIDSIILTHCHADHDAGTFQKILEEGKVTLYTTETILLSFLRKYSSLSNVPIDYLRKLFDFHPVTFGKPVFIHGGRFDMFYTLHSIPCMGFKMSFEDQTFVYSSDHNNDPEIHKKLLDERVISTVRYNELRNFPWDSKVIYHESGIAPLHTPITFLDSLSDELKRKIVVYHIAKNDFPKQTTLQLAKFGIENTLYFETTSPRFEEAYQILGVLRHLDLFENLPIRKAQEFIDIVKMEHYSKGEYIIHKGTKGDKFYIIHSGNVSVRTGGLERDKIYGAYDYFGEVALVTEQNRAADVVAETDVFVYTIGRDRFLNFIVGTDFEKPLHRLAKIRNSETWNLLSTSHFFQFCTASQKTWLESMFVPQDEDEPGTLIREGELPEQIYIIRKGEVEVSKEGREIAVLKRGDFAGSIRRLHKGDPSAYTFSHSAPVSLYALNSDEILLFVERNPGLLMKLVYDF